MKKDWLPSQEHKLAAECRQWKAELEKPENPARYGWLPEDVAAMLDRIDAFLAALEAYDGDKSPGKRALKNRTKVAVKAGMRDFANFAIRFNRKMTEGERNYFGVFARQPASAIPRPTAQPEADITFPGVHLLKLRKIHRVAGIGEDPRAEYGVRIHFGILDPDNPRRAFCLTAEPVTGEDLPHSVFTRRKNHLFDFNGYSGKTVYF
ncbi:MAG: hypothetical protein LBC60_01985, partial [Spirochaetaceae bacterium]|nr:hypothetical protein [Spirochaetaceae bacterium]